MTTGLESRLEAWWQESVGHLREARARRDWMMCDLILAHMRYLRLVRALWQNRN